MPRTEPLLAGKPDPAVTSSRSDGFGQGLDGSSGTLELTVMSGSSYGLTRRAVEYSAAPMSHVWIAACLAIGSACLGAGLLLGMGEIMLHLKTLVLETLFQSVQ